MARWSDVLSRLLCAGVIMGGTACGVTQRAELKKIVRDRTRAPEERFEATLLLARLPRNSARVRLRNRCALTGRPRGYHRKFGMSRIAVRDLGSAGQIPGLVKASW